ncbi:alpha/beta-hydrolase [Xylariaceae sp. FL1019]|nr:alpha/beta-hydrolase [Xylariaceae sp. FL1019]
MAQQSKPSLSVSEVLHLVYCIVRTLSAASLAVPAAIFRGSSGHADYYKHVAHTALRTMNERASARQVQAINPSSVDAYEAFAKAQGFEPNVTSLPRSDGKVTWLGKPEASNILICLHGGGFVYPAAAQFQWCMDLKKQGGQDEDYAVAILAYSLAPVARFPTQLAETVDLLSYLVEEKHKEPSKISIVGDSAGALLGLGVISHLLHTHPDIRPLNLATPLAGIALISPWVIPRAMSPSSKRNALKDVVSKNVFVRWSAYALGETPSDAYNSPATAAAEWWKGTPSVVRDLILTAGRQEILFDDIETFTAMFRSSVPGLKTIFVEETHDQALMDAIIGIKEDCESSKAVKSWLLEKRQ